MTPQEHCWMRQYESHLDCRCAVSANPFRRCYGSAYTARDTRLFAQALNLTPCFTPVANPQSNGMSEAFVKTLKRDYIRIS